jgi:Flp pilus assembly protein TadG
MRTSASGQGLAEFALTIPILLILLMAVFDLGRGIYMYNGVSEAAREIARATSVHPGTSAAPSSETAAVVATQKALVPGMVTPAWPTDYGCSDVADTPSKRHASPCASGEYVTVKVTATYRPVSLLGLLGNIPLSSSSTVAVP